ncbi:MAG: alpha/beta hydrolase [Rhodocyclales bacterium]|jgi:alpha/beta superfamily hydrolase|nr:alpha/beta hydrolase [Rhodocyclales bacterium]MBH1974889.1 alpha/beta hydrolase [Rhodocyclales bacterium]
MVQPVTKIHLIDGPNGKIELAVDLPAEEAPKGIALIGHPHPLFGGTADNKVVTTLSRSFRQYNCVVLRPSFRGVGGSEGVHDHGDKETTDLLAVLAWAKQQWGDLPVTLAGFSFGAFVITRVAKVLANEQDPARWLVLVGTAAGFIEGARSYSTEAVPAGTLVIHGAQDTTVPLPNVLAWAEPLDLPVVVIPGADHFFHRRLHILQDIIRRAWPPSE